MVHYLFELTLCIEMYFCPFLAPLVSEYNTTVVNVVSCTVFAVIILFRFKKQQVDKHITAK